MQYRVKLEMNIASEGEPEWTTVTGRIFETDKTEDEIDTAIRNLEARLSK